MAFIPLYIRAWKYLFILLNCLGSWTKIIKIKMRRISGVWSLTFTSFKRGWNIIPIQGNRSTRHVLRRILMFFTQTSLTDAVYSVRVILVQKNKFVSFFNVYFSFLLYNFRNWEKCYLNTAGKGWINITLFKISTLIVHRQSECKRLWKYLKNTDISPVHYTCRVIMYLYDTLKIKTNLAKSVKPFIRYMFTNWQTPKKHYPPSDAVQ